MKIKNYLIGYQGCDIMDYYTIIIIAIVVIGLAAAAYNFFKLSKEAQIQNIKEWLLLGCLEAEKALGSKTGKIKLRYVYDLFVARFRFMSYFISFEQFSLLVDEALEEMRGLIESNAVVKELINNGSK